MSKILYTTRKLTAERLHVDPETVTPEANFVKDLGADSLDLVELIMGMEEEFSTADMKIKIPDEDAAKIQTVQDAVNYIKALGIADA